MDNKQHRTDERDLKLDKVLGLINRNKMLIKTLHECRCFCAAFKGGITEVSQEGSSHNINSDRYFVKLERLVA